MTPNFVSPAGSLPVYLTYDSQDSPGGMIPSTTAYLKEWVPDLAYYPTYTASSSGNWSTMWGASQPGANDVVLIPAGVTVTYDVASPSSSVKTIGVKGTLVFDSTKNVQLQVGTIFVYPGGSVIIKPNSNVTHQIVFTGTVNLTEDPGQYSLGLVTMGGTVDIEGSNSPNAFAHYTRAQAGENTITLGSSTPSDWLPGDQLILAGNIERDTVNQNFYNSFVHEERVTIQSVSGNVVTLTAPLQYTHNIYTEVNYDGSITGPILSDISYQRVPGMVGHITRNVYIYSANPNNLMSRGHIMFMDDTLATVKNAELEGLGRTTDSPLNDTKRDSSGNVLSVGTNPRGRYPLHAHHVTQPFDFENNAVIQEQDMSLRWGIVNHDSFGTIKGNVVIWKGGSGIVTEYGTETGFITDNLVIGIGGGDRVDDGARTDSNGNRLSVYDFGHAGFGYWFGSRTMEVTNNYADGLFGGSAFDYYIDFYGRGNEQPVTRPDTIPDEMPFVQGEPWDSYGGITQLLTSPNRLFSDNTSYAHNDSGGALLDEWDQSYGNVLRNFTSYDGGFGPNGGGEDQEVVLDNVKLYGLGGFSMSYQDDAAIQRNDRIVFLYVLNSDIENFPIGLDLDNAYTRVENTKFVNTPIPTQLYFLQFRTNQADLFPVDKHNVQTITEPTGVTTAPAVSFVNLDRNTKLNTQSSVSLTVQASDSGGTVSKVEFYDNSKLVDLGPLEYDNSHGYNIFDDGTKIGDGVNNGNGTWTYVWRDPPAGKYQISAKATDSNGATTVVAYVPLEVWPGTITTPIFYKGINFGVNATTTINGNQWEGGNTATDVAGPLPCTGSGSFLEPGCGGNGGTYVNLYPVPLDPPINNTSTTEMYQTSFVYSGDPANNGNMGTTTISGIPTGTYQVYVYLDSPDNAQCTFQVYLQGHEADNAAYTPMVGGQWMKLGPYTTAVDSSGLIQMQLYYSLRQGCPPNVSGMEIDKLEAGGTVINQPPHVTATVASLNTSNPLSAIATLDGTVADLNATSTSLIYHWKVFRSQFPVYFTNETSLDTQAYFFEPGSYELQLVADNGQYTSQSNIVTVDVPSMPMDTSSTDNAAVSGATFYKAYNLGGGSLTIAGNVWKSGSNTDLSITNSENTTESTYSSPAMPLYPNDSTVADSNTASMLRDGVEGAKITISNIPDGNYQVYEYIVDDTVNNTGAHASIRFNGQAVVTLNSDVAVGSRIPFGVGSWAKVGPISIPVTSGQLVLDGGSPDGGHLSVAGVELWTAPGTPSVLSQPSVTTKVSPVTLDSNSTLPNIQSVGASNISTSTATITWTTNTLTNSKVEYGTDTSYASTTAVFDSGGTTSHSVTLTNLLPDTAYDYEVFSTDLSGNTATSTGPSFITSNPSFSWYNLSWGYSKELTINHAEVSSTLTYFPVLVSLTDPDLKGAGYGGKVDNSNGSDILFTSADGTTKLNHEIEFYDPSAGKLTAWVQVPSISAASDTNIFMYFGNTSTTNQQNPSGVWDSNYQVVYHLADNLSSTTVIDSTVNSSSGVAMANTNTKTTTGQVGTALNFNGSTDTIHGPSLNYSAGNSLTFEAWVHSSAAGSLPYDILSLPNFALSYSSSQLFPVMSFASTSARSGTAAISNTWNQLVGTYDGTNLNIYFNGILEATATDTTTSFSAPLYIGSSGGTSAFLPGIIDEVRVSKVSRSSGWIATQYNNQSTPTAFISAGSLQSAPALVISAIAASSATSTATITWTTDKTSDSQVKYGLTSSYTGSSTLNSTLVTSHSVNLAGLSPNTLYHYQVISSNGNPVKSADQIFSTQSVGPLISSVNVTNVSPSTVIITWLTNTPSTGQVNYGTTTSYGQSSSLNSSLSTTHSVTLTNLTGSTTYHYSLVSTDASNNSTNSTDQIFITQTPIPNILSFVATPPSIVSGQSSILSWSTSNATSFSIDQGVGSIATGSSVSVTPTQTTMYTLTADGAGGIAVAQVTVTVTSASSGGGGGVVAEAVAVAEAGVVEEEAVRHIFLPQPVLRPTQLLHQLHLHPPRQLPAPQPRGIHRHCFYSLNN